VRVAFARHAFEHGTARHRQTQSARYFVESLRHGIVARAAQSRVVAKAAHQHQVAVPAAHD
jgi:hypothetical protein